MKKVVLKTVIILCTGVFAACGSSKKAMQVVALDGEWNIIAVNGDKIESATSPYLGFDMDENRLYGNAGCNRMTGSFEVDTLNPGKIHFGTIGTTRMMCPDMDVESRVLEALNTVKSYAETESGIELADAEGNAVFEWRMGYSFCERGRNRRDGKYSFYSIRCETTAGAWQCGMQHHQRRILARRRQGKFFEIFTNDFYFDGMS